MNKWVRRSLGASALTAGALLVGGAAAQASPIMVSDDNLGALNGTQVKAPIQAPINVCGVATAIGGNAGAACEGGAAAVDEWAFENTMVSNNNTGALNGTQVQLPIQAPINVCGISVGVLGDAAAACEGGAHAGQDPPEDGNGYAPPPNGDPGYGYGYGDDPGYGYAYDDGSDVSDRFAPESTTEATHDGAGTTMVSSGNMGLLNGTQATIPVQVPINVCGVAVGVLGSAQSGCEGGSSAGLTF